LRPFASVLAVEPVLEHDAVGRNHQIVESRPMLVSTTFDIPGHRIVRHVGLARGITVRSRNALGNIAGGFQSIFGGKLSVFVSLAETARQEAYEHMCQHAAEAIVGMRYDANEIMEGITEVLAYGTGVVVEPVAGA
jgi:uncharacterized protein YbjQ (UPF0145 family)